jgi:hypothetical protein
MTLANHSTYIQLFATPIAKNPQVLMVYGRGRGGEGGEGRGGEGEKGGKGEKGRKGEGERGRRGERERGRGGEGEKGRGEEGEKGGKGEKGRKGEGERGRRGERERGRGREREKGRGGYQFFSVQSNVQSQIPNLKLPDAYSPNPLAFKCFSQLKLELKKNLLVYKYPNR